MLERAGCNLLHAVVGSLRLPKGDIDKCFCWCRISDMRTVVISFLLVAGLLVFFVVTMTKQQVVTVPLFEKQNAGSLEISNSTVTPPSKIQQAKPEPKKREEAAKPTPTPLDTTTWINIKFRVIRVLDNGWILAEREGHPIGFSERGERSLEFPDHVPKSNQDFIVTNHPKAASAADGDILRGVLVPEGLAKSEGGRTARRYHYIAEGIDDHQGWGQ